MLVKSIWTDIEELLSLSLDSLLEKAWDIRTKNFPHALNISVPSAKTYITDHYRNKRDVFVNISVTGDKCALNCEHCKGRLLESMIPAQNPSKLKEIGDALIEKGCKGILISGGALADGMVPLDDYIESIWYLKQRGFKVIVHTGLVNEDIARKLKAVDVDQVLIDIIGDKETINKVYHLDKAPEDFEKSLEILKGAGLEIAPHIIIGLDFGRITGEYNALRMTSEFKPEVIVLVILSPMYGTPMYGVKTPSPEDVAKIAAIARIINPRTRITLGCARPSGPLKIETEKQLIKAGVNSIAYPADEAIDYAHGLGLKTNFKEECCSLL
ncbi:MAG: radical SAM protein [Methanomassiliicoccales archaeon]|nr:MAG: radical SAM protein [Methanomassiliicoccales archaeon]